MVDSEIVPSASRPHAVDKQRGIKTAQVRAMWQLVQECVRQPGESLASKAIRFDGAARAYQYASQCRTGKRRTLANAARDAHAEGTWEIWEEEHDWGWTVALRYDRNAPRRVYRDDYTEGTRPRVAADFGSIQMGGDAARLKASGDELANREAEQGAWINNPYFVDEITD